MLWDAIYNFFTTIFGGATYENGNLTFYDTWFALYFDGTNTIRTRMNNTLIEVMGKTMSLSNYFTLLCTLISVIVIVVLCCLFVVKIIKLVGGLITR